MSDHSLPPNVRRLEKNENFRFSCHPETPCFTECCRQLDLALSPYDVLRLCRGLNISAPEFLDRYAVIEQGEGNIFPLVFLAMIDDGRATCPFVTEAGCSVYRDRPGACRTYPVGRGAYLDQDGEKAEIFVLLCEPHCRGFEDGPEINVEEWKDDQELAIYNECNDLLIPLLQHPRIKEGFRPGDEALERYLEVLYDLDAFRNHNGFPDNIDDRQLLKEAISILKNELYS